MNIFTCRICLEDESTTDNFIVPCKCKGTAKYIHRHCLDKWRATTSNREAFTHCTTCNFRFIIERFNDTIAKQRRRLWIYRYYVCRDLFISLILFISAFLLLTCLCQYLNIYINLEIFDLFESQFLNYCLSTLIIILGIMGFVTFVFLMIGPQHNVLHTPLNNCSGLLFVMLGLIIGIGIIMGYIVKIIDKHKETLWLYQETKHLIVKDFKNREYEMLKTTT